MHGRAERAKRADKPGTAGSAGCSLERCLRKMAVCVACCASNGKTREISRKTKRFADMLSDISSANISSANAASANALL